MKFKTAKDKQDALKKNLKIVAEMLESLATDDSNFAGEHKGMSILSYVIADEVFFDALERMKLIEELYKADIDVEIESLPKKYKYTNRLYLSKYIDK